MPEKTGNHEQRLPFIDIAKALGMLAIVWGHVCTQPTSSSFVYSFHIPLFFFLSGMVFKRDKYAGFGDFLGRRIKSLIIPYIIFSFVTWIVWASFSYFAHTDVDSYWMPLAQTFLAQGASGYLVHNVPLWFVTCLFGIEILYFFISRLNQVLVAVISFGLAVLSHEMILHCSAVDVTVLPWNLEVVCLGIPFYAVGNIVARNVGLTRMQSVVLQWKKAAAVCVMILVAAVYVGCKLNGKVSLGDTELSGNFIFTYFNAFVGIAMVLVVSILAVLFESKLKALLWFGRNSFDAMVLHNPVKGIVCVILGKILHLNASAVQSDIGYSVVAFAISLLGTCVAMRAVDGIKYLFKRMNEEPKLKWKEL